MPLKSQNIKNIVPQPIAPYTTKSGVTAKSLKSKIVVTLVGLAVLLSAGVYFGYPRPDASVQDLISTMNRGDEEKAISRYIDLGPLTESILEMLAKDNPDSRMVQITAHFTQNKMAAPYVLSVYMLKPDILDNKGIVRAEYNCVSPLECTAAISEKSHVEPNTPPKLAFTLKLRRSFTGSPQEVLRWKVYGLELPADHQVILE